MTVRQNIAYSLDKFGELYEEFTKQEEAILDWKAGEYSSGEDRLQNFREIASFTGADMPSVALMYLLKHIQSISLAVRTGDYAWCWDTEGGEGLKQRIADARNYLLLLAAAIDEGAGEEGTLPPDEGFWQNLKKKMEAAEKKTAAMGFTEKPPEIPWV